MTRGPNRLLLLVAASLAATGCFRAARGWQLRDRELQRGLAEQHFPMPPEEALERVKGQSLLNTSSCKDEACRGCWSSMCFNLSPEDGGTRVVLDEPMPEQVTATVWRALDRPASTAAAAAADTTAEAQLEEEDAAFVPQFGATLGVLGMVTTQGELSVGGRVGVRRWHLIGLLSTIAAEYTWFGGPAAHQFGLMLGVELSRWDEFSARVIGAPGYSLSMFVVPTLRPGLAAPLGFRAGVGLHVNNISGSFSFPFFVELGGQYDRQQPHLFFDFGFGL